MKQYVCNFCKKLIPEDRVVIDHKSSWSGGLFGHRHEYDIYFHAKCRHLRIVHDMWNSGNEILADEYMSILNKRSWREWLTDRNKPDKELMEKYGHLKKMRELREIAENKLKEIEDEYQDPTK